MKRKLTYLLSIILLLFGLLTLFLSTSVIFDCFGIRAKEGNYVDFIVWANFISSLLYLTAAVALIKQKHWATFLLWLSTGILTTAFIAFIFYINNGGVHEAKTIGAMAFRTSLTLIFALSAYFLNKSTNQKQTK